MLIICFSSHIRYYVHLALGHASFPLRSLFLSGFFLNLEPLWRGGLTGCWAGGSRRGPGRLSWAGQRGRGRGRLGSAGAAAGAGPAACSEGHPHRLRQRLGPNCCVGCSHLGQRSFSAPCLHEHRCTYHHTGSCPYQSSCISESYSCLLETHDAAIHHDEICCDTRLGILRRGRPGAHLGRRHAGRYSGSTGTSSLPGAADKKMRCFHHRTVSEGRWAAGSRRSELPWPGSRGARARYLALRVCAYIIGFSQLVGAMREEALIALLARALSLEVAAHLSLVL